MLKSSLNQNPDSESTNPIQPSQKLRRTPALRHGTLLALVTALGLAACGTPPDPTATPNPTQTLQPSPTASATGKESGTDSSTSEPKIFEEGTPEFNEIRAQTIAQAKEHVQNERLVMTKKMPGEFIRMPVRSRHTMRVEVPRDGSISLGVLCVDHDAAWIDVSGITVNGQALHFSEDSGLSDITVGCDYIQLVPLGTRKQGDIIRFTIDANPTLPNEKGIAILAYNDGFPADPGTVVKAADPLPPVPSGKGVHQVMTVDLAKFFSSEIPTIVSPTDGTLWFNLSCSGAPVANITLVSTMALSKPIKDVERLPLPGEGEATNDVLYKLSDEDVYLAYAFDGPAQDYLSRAGLNHRYLVKHQAVCAEGSARFGGVPVSKNDQIETYYGGFMFGVERGTLTATVETGK